MKRRVLLSSTVGIVLAGCISGDTTNEGENGGDQTGSNEDDEIKSVTVDSENLKDTEAEYELTVKYNSAVQHSVNPDSIENGGHRSQDGEKYLVLRMLVENTSGHDIDLMSSIFGFETDEKLYPFDIPLGEDHMQGNIKSGERNDGWLVATIPEKVSAGTLKITKNQYYVANYNESMHVVFEKDTSMSVGIDTL